METNRQTQTDDLLRIDHVCTRFYTEYGTVAAVDDVSFSVKRGETLGVVGESGSGKTMTAMSVMNMIENPGRIESGEIWFNNENLLLKSEQQMNTIRGGDIAIVFQDSLSSFNPTLTIGDQIGRVLKYHTSLTKRQIREKTIDLLRNVGIPEPEKRYDNYPHEFSGGMRQRALIAMAISSNPKLLILDEPTTALDVTIEAQIFELIERLKEETQMGIILITHDLSVVANSCERVAVMYAGKVVEQGSVEDVFSRQLHPYTKGLMLSIPQIDLDRDEELYSIPGEVPDLIHMSEGCHFEPRCRYAKSECQVRKPELEELFAGHSSACLFARELLDGK
jgi:oligopeptide/dipeptide ABC transporter ATP-binding protein